MGLLMPVKYLSLLLLALLLATAGINASAKVIHQEKSLYRNILVEENGNLRCLKFNEKSNKTNQSCMFKSEPDRMVFNYTKLLFSALLVQPNPERILIIGLGGGTMSNALHQIFPSAKIDNVEIDPAVIKVARQYFHFVENDQVVSHVKDGRIFIKRALLKKQEYDWIILDAFNGDYIPEHLLTKEFLAETKTLLSSNGVLTANTFSTSKLYNYESATYQAVFDSFYMVRNNKNQNRIILATKGGLPEVTSLQMNLIDLHDKLKRFGVNINRVYQGFTDEQDWPADTPVLTDQFSPANLLNH